MLLFFLVIIYQNMELVYNIWDIHVFAYQEWGSTKQNYEIMNNIELEDIYKTPKEGYLY